MRSVLVAVIFALACASPGCAEEEVGKPQGRSSFWGSDQPSKHGAYRWRLLGIGVGLLGITGIVMIRLVRKARSERAAGFKSPDDKRP